jgi:hypothetical protein
MPRLADAASSPSLFSSATERRLFGDRSLFAHAEEDCPPNFIALCGAVSVPDKRLSQSERCVNSLVTRYLPTWVAPLILCGYFLMPCGALMVQRVLPEEWGEFMRRPGGFMRRVGFVAAEFAVALGSSPPLQGLRSMVFGRPLLSRCRSSHWRCGVPLQVFDQVLAFRIPSFGGT